MSGFSFDATAGASQSTSKPRLAGNDIYEVKFDGCEIQDITGVKDPTQVYKVIKFKFSNDDGTFEHTVFEPREDDFKRKETEFTNKNGKVEKIPQPSNVESMMLLFKHVIDAFVPSVAAKIDSGEKSLTAPSWDKLRSLVLQIMDLGKDKVAKIKLLKNKNGEAQFPGFFTAVNREGKAYIRNNFIGEKIAFTPYEVTRIQNEANARPTNMSTNTPASFLVPEDKGSESGLDLSFDIGDL